MASPLQPRKDGPPGGVFANRGAATRLIQGEPHLSVLIHGSGLDGFYTLLKLGGFFVAALSAQGFSLGGQNRDNNGIVRDVLFFQNHKETSLAGGGFFWFSR